MPINSSNSLTSDYMDIPKTILSCILPLLDLFPSPNNKLTNLINKKKKLICIILKVKLTFQQVAEELPDFTGKTANNLWVGKNVHFYKICNFHYCIACRLEWNRPSEWLTRLDTSRCFLLHFSSLYPSLHFRFCFLTIAIISKRWFQCFILKISFCFSLKVKASFFFIIGLSAYIKLVKVLLLTWALAFPLQWEAEGGWVQ